MRWLRGINFTEFIRLIFGFIIFASGLLKLFDLSGFVDTVVAFNLLPTFLVPVAAYTLPVIEIVLGLFILTKKFILLTLHTTTIILTIFLGVISLKFIEGAKISCGCFGPLSRENISIYTLIRDIVILGLCVYLQIKYATNKHQGGTLKLVASILFILIITQNIIFAKQNQELKGRLALLIPKSTDLLRVGDILPSIDMVSTEMNNERLQFDNSDLTLLLIFSTKCNPCRQNLINWNNINDFIGNLANSSIQLLGISTGDASQTIEFYHNNQINFKIFFSTDTKFATHYKPYYVPLTIIINKKGGVEYFWKGVLDTKTIKEVTQFIKNRSSHDNT